MGPYGTFLGQDGSCVDNHYGAQMGFANDIGMGPTWVQIWGPNGTFLGQHGPYVGYYYETQMGFANYIGIGPHGLRYGARMGPFWDNMGPMWVTIMEPDGFCK